jgi:hypothetical protein
MSIDDKVLGTLGLVDNVKKALEYESLSLDEKVAAMLDLKDNPAIQTAGQFGQQQPSAALPQLTESLTQLAMKQVQEEMNKSTAINDPMEAENERLRRQLENLRLQDQIAELQAKQQQQQQAAQPQPQGAPPPQAMGGGGAPAGGMPGGEAGGMPPDLAAMYGAVPPQGPEQGQQQQGGGQMDAMEMLRQAAGG